MSGLHGPESGGSWHGRPSDGEGGPAGRVALLQRDVVWHIMQAGSPSHQIVTLFTCIITKPTMDRTAITLKAAMLRAKGESQRGQRKLQGTPRCRGVRPVAEV